MRAPYEFSDVIEYRKTLTDDQYEHAIAILECEWDLLVCFPGAKDWIEAFERAVKESSQ